MQRKNYLKINPCCWSNQLSVWWIWNVHLVIKQIKIFVNEFTKYIIRSMFSTRQSSRMHMPEGHDPCNFSPPPISCLVLQEANVYLTNTSRHGLMSLPVCSSYLHHMLYMDCWINITGSHDALLISQKCSVSMVTLLHAGWPRICSLIPCKNNRLFSSPKQPTLALAPTQTI